MTAGYRQLLPVSALVTVLAIGAVSCGNNSRSAASVPASAAIEAQTSRATLQNLSNGFEVGGTVRSRTTADLASRIVAEVREVRVRAGDRVKRGQTLIVLDSRDLAAGRVLAAASLVAARQVAASAEADHESSIARLAFVRATYERTRGLREKNSATPQELDAAVAELRGAEAGVRAASARVAGATAAAEGAGAARESADVAASFGVITAPFDGVVVSTRVDPGNMASPGVPLVVLEQADAFRVDVQVDESRAGSLREGDDTVVDLGAAGDERDRLTGRVAEIARSNDPSAHAFMVKIALPSSASLRSGMFARVTFAGKARQALVVPAASIVRRGQLTLLFAIDSDHRARMRAISPGVATGDLVEVLAGVEAGEAVIVNPGPSIVDGTPVRVAGERR